MVAERRVLMATDIQVRPMKKSDVKDVVKLRGEFEAYLQKLSGKKRRASAAAHRKRFLRDCFGKNPAFRSIVARKDGAPVGYVCYHLGYDPDEMCGRVIYVIDLFVTPEARGFGVGTLLMKKVRLLCRKMRGIGVCFCVWKKNKAAIKFYKKLGADWVRDVPLMRWN